MPPTTAVHVHKYPAFAIGRARTPSTYLFAPSIPPC
jgi:hypothetical protein